MGHNSLDKKISVDSIVFYANAIGIVKVREKTQ